MHVQPLLRLLETSLHKNIKVTEKIKGNEANLVNNRGSISKIYLNLAKAEKGI